MKYSIGVNIHVAPIPDNGTGYQPGTGLSFYKNFEVEAENFTDLGPRIDAVVAAAELVAQKVEQKAVPTPPDATVAETGPDAPETGDDWPAGREEIR